MGALAESFNYGLNASAMEFDGENKYIRITDIDEESHRFIQSGLTSPNTDLSNADDYLLKEGDILFARTGASVGKSYQYEPLDGKVYYAGFLIRARIKPEFDSSYIFQSTLTEKYKNFIKISSQRSGQPGVNAQEYASFSVSVPSRAEQEKIGTFFKQLDDTITLHQDAIQRQQDLKKALLQKLFPVNGERIPTVRFATFKEEWEQRKFFDNIQNTIDFRGRTPKKLGMDWSESGYLALSALNVKNGYIDPSADAHYGNEELYKKWMGGRELRKGQVLFTTEAPMGNVAQVPDNQGYILSQRTITFDVNDEKITDDFLAVLLRSPNVFNDLSALSSGGTAKGVSQRSLSGLKVIVPKNLCEQEKIGLFFKQLESTIALHQDAIHKLQLLKQSLLQKMFV